MIEFITPHTNTKIKANDYNDIDFFSIQNYLYQIWTNIGYKTGYLDNLTIEVYRKKDANKPQNLSAGLYYYDKKADGRYLVQILNDWIDLDSPERYISNVLSHEVGHHYVHMIGFNSDEQKEKYYVTKLLKSMINESIKNTNNSSNETIAEFFRKCFGSNLAKDFTRGDYIQPENIRGLYKLLEIYKRCKEYEESIDKWWLFNGKTHKFNSDNQLYIIYSTQNLLNPFDQRFVNF